jgi:histidinol-phosphate phosphatase family protein
MNDILSVPQWTLFLDRDGVINKRIVDGYVLHYEELILMPFLKEALHLLKGKFYKIIVVSNQQSVGKGLCSYDEVVQIHNRLNEDLQKENIAIDHFFFCPHKADIQCGHALGMTTVYVGEKDVPNRDQIMELADFSFENLYEFAQLFKSK